MSEIKPDLKVLGSTGLKQFNGYVLEEFLPELHGPRGVRLYREMRDNDSTIGAVHYTIKNLARNASREIVPAKDGQEEADFIMGAMDDMSHTFDDLVSEIFSFLPFGWSYFEQVFKRREGDSRDPSKRSKYTDGKIGWRKIAIRSQETLLRWEFDDDGGIRGLWQLAPPLYQVTFIPIEKSLLFRTELHKGNPEGRSLLRNSVIDYFYKKRIQETEAIGISRDMTGLITMEVPQEMLSDNPPPGLASLRSQLEVMLSSIHRDQREFAMIPPEIGPDGSPTGFKLKLLASGGKRQMSAGDTIMRLSKNIAMTMMGELIFMGNDKAGSYAMSKTKANMLGTAVGTMLSSAGSVFHRFAFPKLLKLNGLDPRKAPELRFSKVFAPDPEEIANYVTRLSAVGAIETGKELSDKLLDIAGLPISTSPVDQELLPSMQTTNFMQAGNGDREKPEEETAETEEGKEPANDSKEQED